mmetsp:Transcript_15416/g.26989  ORF Transcript_15416/g.26989 Transcript_15416/m.26989 type:complete len:202 (+) Transcript_15416:732-1337(+)
MLINYEVKVLEELGHHSKGRIYTPTRLVELFESRFQAGLLLSIEWRKPLDLFGLHVRRRSLLLLLLLLFLPFLLRTSTFWLARTFDLFLAGKTDLYKPFNKFVEVHGSRVVGVKSSKQIVQVLVSELHELIYCNTRGCSNFLQEVSIAVEGLEELLKIEFSGPVLICHIHCISGCRRNCPTRSFLGKSLLFVRVLPNPDQA